MKTIFTKPECKVTWKCPGCGVEISEKEIGCDICINRYGSELLKTTKVISDYELCMRNGDKFKFKSALIQNEWLTISDNNLQIRISEMVWLANVSIETEVKALKVETK